MGFIKSTFPAPSSLTLPLFWLNMRLMLVQSTVLHWATLHFFTLRVSSGGEGTCHLYCVQEKTLHAPPSSHTCLADTSAALAGKYTHLRPNQKTKRKIKELEKMLNHQLSTWDTFSSFPSQRQIVKRRGEWMEGQCGALNSKSFYL